MNDCIFCQTCTIFGTNHCHEQCPDYDPVCAPGSAQAAKNHSDGIGEYYRAPVSEVKIND